MIDTIKFKIPIYDVQKIELSKNFAKIQKSKANGDILYNVITDNIQLGSFEYSVNIYVPKDLLNLYIEFSLPKLLFGHNTIMAFIDDLPDALTLIRTHLSKFVSLPPIDSWQVNRLDVCYNWSFADSTELFNVLTILHLIDFPRKKKYIYDTSVMYKGSSYTLKFYLKHPEFIRHDFRKLYRIDPVEAMEAFSLSENMLRFEMTMRKSYLTFLLKKPIIIYKDLFSFDYASLINGKLKLFAGYINDKAMNKQSVLKKLKKVYPDSKAIRLFNFWNQFYNGDMLDKHLVCESYSRTQIWRNKRDLNTVGISYNSRRTKSARSLDLKAY